MVVVIVIILHRFRVLFDLLMSRCYCVFYTIVIRIKINTVLFWLNKHFVIFIFSFALLFGIGIYLKFLRIQKSFLLIINIPFADIEFYFPFVVYLNGFMLLRFQGTHILSVHLYKFIKIRRKSLLNDHT